MANQNNFCLKNLIRAALPSYFFPATMSFLPGYFLQDPGLMQASYTTIAIPSLLSTLITFFILKRMQMDGEFPSGKIMRAIYLTAILLVFGIFVILCFNLTPFAKDILPSVFLGAVITSLTQKMSK